MLRPGIMCELNVPISTFISACFEAARVLDGEVAELREPDPLPRYCYAALRYPQETVAVLCNRAFPLIAFSAPFECMQLPPEFVDRPALEVVFRKLSFECLPAAKLESPLSSVDLSVVLPEEREDVEYWQPKKVGHVIFNYFD